MYTNADSIKELLNSTKFAENIICLGSVDSTNSYLKNSYDVKDGTVVISEQQTGGRGRRGKTFLSPIGGIYMSLLYNTTPDKFDPGKITSCVALSVCKAIESVTALEPKIKWVNDVFLGDKKVCGILCEAVNDSQNNLKSVIIGIGLNVDDVVLGADLDDIATNLEKETGANVSKNMLVAEILNNLEKDLYTTNTPSFIEQLRTRYFILGKKIKVTTVSESYFATAVDIDSSCRLIVKRGERNIVISSAEVSISQ